MSARVAHHMSGQSREARAAAIDALVGDLKHHPLVERMKRYKQHGDVSTYEHCERVTEASYRLNRFLRLKADERSLLRGAMLHDFYLYDWHKKDGGTHRWHGFHHAKRAAENAKTLLGVSEKERQIIASHMWPLSPTHIPRSREAWIVCLTDKWCSLQETLFMRRKGRRP